MGATVYDHCDPETLSATDFNDRCGKVFAILVPAGDYVLSSWNITDNAGVLGPRDWHPAKVTIQPGKITYVGNIHMVFDRNLPGWGPLEWRGWPVASDAHERDLPILMERHDLLRQSDVTMDILHLDPPGPLCALGDAIKRSNTVC